MRLKHFVFILALLALIILTPAVVKYGIEKSEKNECHTWARQATTRPGFYLTSWQKQQCDHYGIKVETPAPKVKAKQITGVASWYDYDTLGDQRCTKDRQPCYSQRADTCASRDYQRGTTLLVIYNVLDDNNLKVGYWVKCRVNDYGPADTTRVIDLSSHAFAQLAPLSAGLINVTVEEVK